VMQGYRVVDDPTDTFHSAQSLIQRGCGYFIFAREGAN